MEMTKQTTEDVLPVFSADVPNPTAILSNPTTRRWIPAGVFVLGSVDMPGAESSSRAILYIERNPETV